MATRKRAEGMVAPTEIERMEIVNVLRAQERRFC